LVCPDVVITKDLVTLAPLPRPFPAHGTAVKRCPSRRAGWPGRPMFEGRKVRRYSRTGARDAESELALLRQRVRLMQVWIQARHTLAQQSFE
jgi:hypothetical protein